MTATLVRTQEEIVSRINSVCELGNDPFGFECSEYVPYLDFEHAKPFLKEDTTPDDWKNCPSEKSPVDCIREYMTFAFEKAWDERGISANRSIQHFIAWAWLSGDDELHRMIEEEYASGYDDYGKPILRMICQHFAWDSKEFGDH